jgi:site-specific recombinase XerC
LAAIRMCFDWLVTGGVLTVNPAHAVRGPKHCFEGKLRPAIFRHGAAQSLPMD